ncbi:DUF3265 domain-containing protein [Vibrio cholerae]|nr:DUF3265 domain-containing protein [Vibrio cholerae]EGR1702078.1 DUF3265 domain-containing protein [Vibrio cholerae]EGR2416390.1 DUF3265 domain-containing protein [Vibrio cholerae]EGR4374062.1 DUF3265 domain-containing protein [Vibrio cholerae]KAA1206840.1 DUF3265 domain-containing protein [Vibrio cholerae]KAA1220730.1 DUF3265 domain-containing protein [Vibrio cholerae]
MDITNCLRVIRNAWHFCYALRLVFKGLCCVIVNPRRIGAKIQNKTLL